MSDYSSFNAKAVSRKQLRVDKAQSLLDKTQPATDLYDTRESNLLRLKHELAAMTLRREQHLAMLDAEHNQRYRRICEQRQDD